MPKSVQPKKTWSYTADFKVKAVKYSYQPQAQVKQVAEDFEIHPGRIQPRSASFIKRPRPPIGHSLNPSVFYTLKPCGVAHLTRRSPVSIVRHQPT